MSKNKVAGLTPITKKEVTQEVEESPFEHLATAYVAVMNEETKKYDILIIKIDTRTDKAVVMREPQRYDSHHRALQDTIKRISDNLIKGTK